MWKKVAPRASAVAGVVVGAGLWTLRAWAIQLLVMGGGVAHDSVVAMLVRTGVWATIATGTRRARAGRSG